MRIDGNMHVIGKKIVGKRDYSRAHVLADGLVAESEFMARLRA
jgi:hypothetical protein